LDAALHQGNEAGLTDVPDARERRARGADTTDDTMRTS